MERMPKRAPRSGRASVLIFTTSQRPAFARATFSSSGATMRHGPHQGAQKSTTTGRGEAARSALHCAAFWMSSGTFGAARSA